MVLNFEHVLSTHGFYIREKIEKIIDIIGTYVKIEFFKKDKSLFILLELAPVQECCNACENNAKKSLRMRYYLILILCD